MDKKKTETEEILDETNCKYFVKLHHEREFSLCPVCRTDLASKFENSVPGGYCICPKCREFISLYTYPFGWKMLFTQKFIYFKTKEKYLEYFNNPYGKGTDYKYTIIFQ